MNTAVLIAASGAAAAAREADERLLEKLLSQDAVSESRAVLLAPENSAEARALVRLLERGVLREAGGGRYWIDPLAPRVGGGLKRRRAAVLLAASVLVFAGFLFLLAGRDRHASAGPGVTLVHAAGYVAERGPEGWLLRPSAAAAPSRAPVQIEVALVAGDVPRKGRRVRIDDRRLRRSVETVAGGSSGAGRLLIWREAVGDDGFVEYRQLAYADGGEPAFELDRLIRGNVLAVR
jgi:hypothetical protein